MKNKIFILEPFLTGSHQKWAEELRTYSEHEIEIFSLPGHHWKWRMHGGAISLAQQVLESNNMPDLFLANDMVDLSTFLSLIRKKHPVTPAAIYFHENQISYPWSPTDQDPKLGRDNHYGFINYTSALAADKVFFNSNYHKNSFLEALPKFLKQFPDFQNLGTIAQIEEKSEVLYLGLDLQKLDRFKRKKHVPHKEYVPTILWNHRWEYDKNPEEFFSTLKIIKEKKIPFKLCIMGQQLPKSPKVFSEAKEFFRDEIIHWGFANSFKEYATKLWESDILYCPSQQDFFGISVVEALYCENHPILPNRLAYPEHVDKTFLYDTQEKALSKLEEALLGLPNPKNHNVSRYDWSSIINNYNQALMRVIGA